MVLTDRTLYHHAVMYNNVVIMRLLEQRSSQDRQSLNKSRDTSTGRSPLHDAVSQGSQDAVDELLGSSGAMPVPTNERDDDGD
jgi:ankyrin repeat protein